MQTARTLGITEAWKRSERTASLRSGDITWSLSPLGCSGGWGGKFHHSVLHPAGLRGLPYPDGDPQHVRLGGTVHHQSSSQTSQTGHLWTTVLLLTGIQHSHLLPRWHTGCPEGGCCSHACFSSLVTAVQWPDILLHVLSFLGYFSDQKSLTATAVLV